MSSVKDNGTDRTDMIDDSNTKKKNKKKDEPMASVGETMSFVWDCGPKIRLAFLLGCLAAVGNGCVYPVLAYVFSNSFSSISAASDGLAEIRRIAYIFMIVGAYALVVAFFQSGLLEVVAYHAARSFRLQWFRALLRQDVAYFDVYDVSGIAATIGPNSKKFRRGLGSKFGEGIQFGTTFVGGIVYAFYSSWQVALVIIGLLPVVSITALAVMNINQTKGSSAAQAYSRAGSVAYSTVSAIKTVLSLNAVKEMIRQYSDATREAYEKSVKLLWKTGFANGSMLGTFILLYCILTLFGTFLIWRDVEETGCDPSNSVDNNETCDQSGSAVFGAMLGVAFAAQGLTQCGNFFATFTEARVACHAALQAMNRKPGSPEEKIYKDSSSDQDDKSSTASDIEEGYSEHDDKKKLKAILPAYEIDSSSSAGLRPKRVKGAIRFQGVDFHYPTRPDAPILEGFSLDIEAGKTVALVGPSGGGKSTTVALIERFYDPQSGSVSLDGTDIKDINVHYLRSLIGYVGQEPALFATTIRGNIKYGKPDATQDEIEAAAKMANAHDFIVSFPDGYDTQVGDKGSSLSGGQKQRIAIARILVSKPKILLLDEATSALDSESELVVQEALDNVLSKHKRTTVVIAHRLSTIRNADLIAVVAGGRVVETGTHDELMAKENGAYFRLVESQDRRPSMASRAGSLVSSRSNSYGSDLNELEELGIELSDAGIDLPHFNFKDVTFAYPTRPKRNVLDGFNLSVRRGETIALVGPSGGGKSTTVSLIERFYDVNSGSIEYSGVDIRSLNVHWYRDQIGYVGQEPVLFNGTIAENIAYGAPGATRKEIEQAARQANAHDFISSFPSGYETAVGERGTQLSGGQKQRVAIARALIKQPKILLLDEATSALDSQSEAVVQEALDKLMESRDHTTIVIAHRLSTIRNVDRIAFVADGVVKEYGSHDELLSRHHGRYKRLYEAQTRRVSASHAFGTSLKKRRGDEEEEEKPDFDAEIEEAEEKAFNMKRAREMARPDAWYMLLGSIGAIIAGGVFPAWGIMFGETINLLFRRVPDCEDLTLNGINCDDFNQAVADSMRERSFVLAGYWVVVAVGAVVGNMVTFYGFGKASERLSKRVRDSAFASLVRQEVSFFDKRSVGSITTQLEDDAAKIEAFSGEPIRSLLIALSSLIVGLVVSFIFMWPFALLAVACIPVMGISMSIEMSRFLGTDESEGNGQDELNSPGGIAVETLLNIRTVAALTLEEERYHNYEVALQHDQPHYIRDSFVGGLTAGFSMFVQQWVNALEFWWGGWLLFNYPDVFTFHDFLTSMFALLFSLFGLGAAFQGMSDRKEAEKSAGRIFYLLDRKSEIDPLSEDGKKLDADHYAKIPRPSYYEGNASWKARTENFDLHELFAQKSLRHNGDAPPLERRHTHHHPQRRNSDAEGRRHKHKKHKKHVKRRHSTAA